MNEIEKKIEALLFISGGGMTLHALATRLKQSESDIKRAVEALKAHLKESHDLVIVEHDHTVGLATSSHISSLVEEFAREEFSGDLTRSALETLAIVAYKGPIRRADIDYIRGVNSSFMIRNLLMRGLIERARDENDSRSYAYRVSTEFLKFLGLTSLEDLPDYGTLAERLEEFIGKTETPASHEE